MDAVITAYKTGCVTEALQASEDGWTDGGRGGEGGGALCESSIFLSLSVAACPHRSRCSSSPSSPVLSAFVIDCSRPFDALTNDAVVTVLAGDGVGVLLSHVDRVALSVHRTTRAKLASIQIHFGTRPSLLGGFCGEFLLGI